MVRPVKEVDNLVASIVLNDGIAGFDGRFASFALARGAEFTI
jgi:hypothetical protein